MSMLTDIRLCNLLIEAPPTISKLSIGQFRERFDEPEVVPVDRIDGASLQAGVPPQVVLPLNLSKEAQEFTIDDTRGLVLCDFGETFALKIETRLRKECNTPVAKRAPEAAFEPDKGLTFALDVWSLGVAIWGILGMKAIFSESEPMNEVIAEQLDVLGTSSLPAEWWAIWNLAETTELKPQITRPPKSDRDRWPPLEQAFEEFVQHYRRKREPAGVFDEEETRLILNLVRSMLQFHPEKRPTTKEVLKSDWIVKYALPELERG